MIDEDNMKRITAVTMRDIGQAAGVSAVTVSKALAGKDGVGEETRQKIVGLARAMGYANPSAVQTGEKRQLDVGILVPEHFFSKNSFYSMLYQLLVQALKESRHFSLLEIIQPEMEKEKTLPNLLKSSRVDALILLGQPDPEYMRLIVGQGTHTVFLDFYDEDACTDAVVGDNTYGAYLLTSHLIKNSHRDIGFVGSLRATSSIMDRYLGYCRAMITHDLPIRDEWIIPDRDESGQFIPLSLPERLPTGFVCNCDLVACFLIEALKKRGVRVPQDVSVVGFDDFAGAKCAPALSTFHLDSRSMVDIAVNLVEDRCAGVVKPFSRTVVSGQPIYRSSVIPPKPKEN